MTKRLILLIYPDVQLLDVFGPAEILAAARDEHGQPLYHVQLAGPQAGPIRGSSGLQAIADLAWADLNGTVDTFLVAGGAGSQAASADPRLISTLQRMAKTTRRFGSVCTGAYPLAAAGLLDGVRATTHWGWAQDLAANYPKVILEPDAIYLRDGKIVTSAGVTAGQDLALALVEEDAGFAAAMKLARRFVMFLRRPGGQSQFSAPLQAQMAGEGVFAGLTQYILDHLDADLSVNTLADRAIMSLRHFQRKFTAEIGMAPAAFVEKARLDCARRLLETSGASIEVVARRTGFSSAEHLRRALNRRLGATPRTYRARFSHPVHERTQ
jgi:transcriptional regulator GlxA family with amidase domain